MPVLRHGQVLVLRGIVSPACQENPKTMDVICIYKPWVGADPFQSGKPAGVF